MFGKRPLLPLFMVLAFVLSACGAQNLAVNQGSVTEWFLAQVLNDNGLSLSDVKEKNMKSCEAGAAFVASKVDVAVTWEPWLSKAKTRTDGHILVSSKQYPDLIMDSF